MFGSIAFVALSLLSRATPPAANSFGELVDKANAARDAKHLDEALGYYRKALKIKPDWEEGLWNAGSISYDQDEYAECSPHFHHLAKLKPDLAPAWTMAGLCDYSLRDYGSALGSFRRAERLGFKEDSELAHSGKLHFALVLSKTGNFETALPVLGALVRSYKKTPEITVAAGIAGLRKAWIPSEVPEGSRDLVWKLGDALTSVMELDYKTAIAKFETASAEFPSEPNVHFRFGAYLMQQMPDRGIEELKKTLELDPGHVPALVGLTMIYLDRDDAKSALDYARKAVQASPGDFACHVALGRALLGIDDAAGAAKELETSVKLAPDNTVGHLNLATAYGRLGREDDARKEREEFKRLQKLIDSPVP